MNTRLAVSEARSRPAPPVRSASRRARAAFWSTPWPLAGLLSALALVAVLANHPGLYIGDNRFEFYWAPRELLRRHLSIWEPDRGLGRMRWDYWPATTAYLAALREAGLSPALAERAWHATLLAAGGIGAAVGLRCFRPRLGAEHLVAGLLYMFNPVSAVYLVPSNLYVAYALAPWLMYAFVRGTRGDRPWRWAAVFALLVFVPGNLNYPALAFACVALVPAALYLVLVERSVGWAAVMTWSLRAGALAVLVSAGALVTSHYSDEISAQNLAETETPPVVFTASSWSESWRGLGFWLVYWRDARGLIYPQFARYFWFPITLVTFAVPLTALATLWRSRWRPRLLFAAIMLVGVTLMVGGFPTTGPPPFGRVLLELFERSPAAAGFRNTYKAGPLLALGAAALVAVGVVELASFVRRRAPSLVRFYPLPLVVAFIAVSFPFWTGKLYPPNEGTAGVPGYWRRAADWIDAQPAEGRVLVLPSTVNGEYRWGSTGDDIVEALIQREHIARPQLSLFHGTAESANLIAALDDHLANDPYRAGTIGPIARRLGIRYLLLRNDLDWEAIHRPRPEWYQRLRADPDLRLAATFGRPGENTVSERRPSAIEEALPPIEVYEVRGAGALARVDARPPLLVAGDGAAWPRLAADGVLDRAGPIRYTAAGGREELVAHLEAGSEVVVTDTNRRRIGRIPIFDDVAGYWHTLSEGEDLFRPTPDLFERTGSQSVTWYPDATKIHASVSGSLAFPQPFYRASNAFDGETETSWRMDAVKAGGRGPADRWVRVDLREPLEVSELEIVTAPPPTGRRSLGLPHVVAASAHFSDGSEVFFDLEFGRDRLTFSPRVTEWIEVRMERIQGDGDWPVGLAEVRVPGADLREHIQVPRDLLFAADSEPRLKALLEEAPITYAFTRLGRSKGEEVEPQLRRRFWTLATREYRLSGRAATIEDWSGCRHDILVIDAEPIAVRSVGAGPDGQLRFRACAPVELGPGWHTLEGGDRGPVDELSLATGIPSAASRSRSAASLERGGGRIELEFETTRPAAVMTGTSYDSGWEAKLDGNSAGAPLSLDTQAAFVVDGPGRHALAAEQRAQRVYRAALVVTMLSVLVCIGLIVSPRPR